MVKEGQEQLAGKIRTEFFALSVGEPWAPENLRGKKIKGAADCVQHVQRIMNTCEYSTFSIVW